MYKHILEIDPDLYTIINNEHEREETTINLIASENYVDKAVLEATGSILTNKYAEGYPGKRYYSGCQCVDQAENLAIERCKQLFGAEHANVQPHAGSQANMAVFNTVLNPGDTLMGMSLSEGGHLTHGHNVNFSGKWYKAVQYTVHPETHELDYDDIAAKAEQFRPKLIICGASAYSRRIDFARFATIAKTINAVLVADIAHIAGLVATGLHPSPVGHADFITSTTHKTLRGPRGGLIMCNNTYASALDKTIMPGLQGGPFMHVIAAKAVAFKLALQPSFVTYQQNIIANAAYLATLLQELGYVIVTGGTDNHLFVVDLRNKEMTGLQAQNALETAGITVTKSTIPFDPQKPWITSGIRLGTPAITTRGMMKGEMQLVATFINDALTHFNDEGYLKEIRKKVEILCKKFPIYQ